MSNAVWARLALALCAGCANPKTEPYDLVLTGGKIADGTGKGAWDGDVAIRGDRIASLAAQIECAAPCVRLDVHGLVVAPGFIDVLSMSGESLLSGDGRQVNKITQGIATEILGEGWTAAPANERVGDPRRFGGPHGFDSWLRAMEGHGNTTNAAALLGATTLRLYAMGAADRAPNLEELTVMRDTLAAAMKDGALGLGAALIYPPGSYAGTAELTELCKVVGQYHGVYASHLRSEGDALLSSLDEAIQIGRAGHARVEIFHFKAMGERNWPKLAAAIEKIAAARRAGLTIGVDTFPYTMSGTLLTALLPPWASAGGRLLSRLGDEQDRARIHAAMLEKGVDWENIGELVGPENILVEQAHGEQVAGETLAHIASARGCDWAQAVIELLRESRGQGSMLVTTMDEQGIRLRLSENWTTVGTDAGGRTPLPGRAVGHPRAFGTFARILGHYVREQHLMTLEHAVHGMTAAAATQFGLTDRGVLRPGAFADVVVFDPQKISDRATYERPLVASEGVDHLLVNGVLVIADGVVTGRKPGRALRGPGWVLSR